jgi:hypothetical protein
LDTVIATPDCFCVELTVAVLVAGAEQLTRPQPGEQ